jgi:hypothetical protein
VYRPKNERNFDNERGKKNYRGGRGGGRGDY